MRKMKVLWLLLMIFLGWSVGRPFEDELYLGRKLHQFIGNCSKGSDKILTKYPSVISLRYSFLEQDKANVLCGGVLLSTDRILTSVGCIWQEVAEEIPFELAMDDQFSKTLESAISPYCTHGDGAEVVKILGYHLMEGDYTGYPKDGNAVALLELKQNVTSLTNQQLPGLRTSPLPVGSIITMVGHGATTKEEASFENLNYSRPFKEIYYQKISEEECMRLLDNLQSYKLLDGVTESCAVLQGIQEMSICIGDDGNPLFDSEGNIAGIITWWPNNQCEQTNNQKIPIIFADISKPKVQAFIAYSQMESPILLPNITNGCGDNQSIQAAPWSISIQYPTFDDPTDFVHVCGGALIDNGRKVVTAAQCIWNDFFPLSFSAQQMFNRSYLMTFDFREPESPYEGNFIDPIFASLAPRCRHFNGVYPRNQINSYVIHPQYNGNPRDGNNIAILSLSEQFPQDQSFPNFEQFLKQIDDHDLSRSDFSNVVFYSWGAETSEEAEDDLKGYINNFFPAKQVSMELISKQECAQQKTLEARAFDQDSELCTDQPSNENFTYICVYDEGGPLVGRLRNTNELVLLGLKSQPIDRQCNDAPGSYEVFTDVIEMKDFILSILDPQKEPSDNARSIVIIIVVVLGISLLVLVISSIACRRCSKNKYVNLQQGKQSQNDTSPNSSQESKQLQNNTSPNLSHEFFKLSKEIQSIHQMLGNFAQKHKNGKTGKLRRHSDLAASLEFMLQHDKIQSQILGYTRFSVDDSFLGATKGAMPSSPFILAAMYKQQSSQTLENPKLPIQWSLIKARNQRIQNRISMSMAFNFGNELNFLNNENVNKCLILSDTPAREDFDMTIDFDKELQIGERLGTGAFGSVFRAVWITKNMEVAVKIIHSHILQQFLDDQKQSSNIFNSIIGELSLLGRIDSPHIVKCYGGSLKPPNVCLVLQYMSKGSLDKFIHGYVGEIPTGLVMRVAQGIAQGLDALHPTVVHRDLKPQNVLLDENYQVKLADFGMSKMKENTYLSETMLKGTPAYIAPEIFKGESVDEKCDIYALGLIIWEMVAKEHPWQDLNQAVAIMARVAIKGERPPIPDTCPNELKRLIQRCWATNPRERPTAIEVAQRLAILRRGPSKNYRSDINACQKQFSSHFSSLQEKKEQSNQQSVQDLSSNFSQFTNYSQFSIQSSAIQNENFYDIVDQNSQSV